MVIFLGKWKLTTENNMAIIGNIDGIPVFDKKEEALVWGKRNDLTGYHTHNRNGTIGYMGGSDHAKAVQKVRVITNPTTPTMTTTTTPPPTTTRTSGGGGY